MTIPASSKLTWVSEQPNPASMGLDMMPTDQIVQTLVSADAQVAGAVAAVSEALAAAVELFVGAIHSGGTVHYVGAGTSGRMGVLDAVELWPTFGMDDTWVRAHLAGGLEAMLRAAEGAEDDVAAGEEIAIQAGPNDLIFGIAASGRTPFVRGALAKGRERGLKTVLLSTNPASPLADLADVAILPDTGAEVLTGSTRLKAATAQKMVLNTVSTASMVRLGKTFSNLMIDMIPTNEKLRARSVLMLRQASGASEAEAASALDAAGGAVRVALVSLLAKADAASAAEAVAAYPADAERRGDPSGIRTAVAVLQGA